MSKMRAKMYVQQVEDHHDAAGNKTAETLKMSAVAAGKYPVDGSDEDNNYARWSPNASLSIHVANPALFEKFTVGEKYYVDFTQAE